MVARAEAPRCSGPRRWRGGSGAGKFYAEHRTHDRRRLGPDAAAGLSDKIVHARQAEAARRFAAGRRSAQAAEALARRFPMLVGEAATSAPGPAGGVVGAAGFREDLAAGAGAGAPAADDGGDGDADSPCGIGCEATDSRRRGSPDAGRMASDTTAPGTTPGYPGNAGASWSIGGRGDEGCRHCGRAASPEPFTDTAIAGAALSQAAFFGQLDVATARGAWA